LARLKKKTEKDWIIILLYSNNIDIKRMGTSAPSQNDSSLLKYATTEKTKSAEEYLTIIERVDSIVGKPKIVKSTLTNI
jgi:hypothetical protein